MIEIKSSFCESVLFIFSCFLHIDKMTGRTRVHNKTFAVVCLAVPNVEMIWPEGISHKFRTSGLQIMC